MKMFWSVIFLLTAGLVLADHESEHTEAPIDVSYETVTRIINALKTPEVVEQTTVDIQEEEPHEQDESEPTEDFEEQIVPDSAFEKRKQVYIAKIVRRPLHKGKTVSELADNEEHLVLQEESCDDDEVQHVEIVEEDHDERPGYVGSLRGTPGVDYPNYDEIPLTSFSCADKKQIPGFYADVETYCQVFHVCYPHRRESFLCPIGTTFNQPILACDYWYNFNCSSAHEYFDMEEDLEPETVEDIVEELISSVEVEPTEPPVEHTVPVEHFSESPVEPIAVYVEQKQLPSPAPEPISVEVSHKPLRPILPAQQVAIPVKVRTPDIVSIAKFLPVKAKVVKFAAPMKTAAVAKGFAAAAPIKVAKVAAKGKVVAKAVPVAKMVKAAAAKVVLGKAKVAAPLIKAAAVKAALKTGKIAVVKTKAAKVAAVKAPLVISALTKKQLALSLIKLMKAQKLRHLQNAALYMY